MISDIETTQGHDIGTPASSIHCSMPDSRSMLFGNYQLSGHFLHVLSSCHFHLVGKHRLGFMWLYLLLGSVRFQISASCDQPSAWPTFLAVCNSPQSSQRMSIGTRGITAFSGGSSSLGRNKPTYKPLAWGFPTTIDPTKASSPVPRLKVEMKMRRAQGKAAGYGWALERNCY